jgi:anhydro-N-acetylmuramic acid kinase
MSGTSLDGLDMAICSFDKHDKRYSYSILAAETVPYRPSWKKRLENAASLTAHEFVQLNAQYGKFTGDLAREFIASRKITVSLVSSHGHTVFHQPQSGFSTQIGCGPTIAATTGIDTVYDFRTLDVALGGQGAPLVPIGDELLFGEFEACLNLGGIANISLRKDDCRIAYDICVANMLLNSLAMRVNKPYDRNGELARQGRIINALLEQLNGNPYYSQSGARSIGREWFAANVEPLFENHAHIPELLATATEHVAVTIAKDLQKHNVKNVLVTGGGAWNGFLMERIRFHSNLSLVIPGEDIVNFKEALIFAFLGYLRVKGSVNTLRSVTGARSDSTGGSLALAPST